MTPSAALWYENGMERILLAVDDSENARRAAAYVGRMLRDAKDAHITLLHVLRTIPRALLEHGGSADPVLEAQMSAQLRREQDAWYRSEEEAESSVFKKAREALEQAGLDPARVTLKFSEDEDIARGILETARRGGYHTVVVGRRGEATRKDTLIGKVTEQLLRAGSGLTLWVVD